MDLKKNEVAELLNVSISTIERLVNEEKLPFYKLGGEIRFNRQEIEDWMMKTHLLSGGLPFGEASDGKNLWQQFGLYRSIHRGEVISNLDASNKEDLIARAMQSASSKLGIDAEAVTGMLLEREKLMPTALGGGVAVPHTREFLLRGLHDAVIVVYPERPMEWGSLDGSPVHTLFFLFACDDRRHLNLLAKIAHLSSSHEVLHFLERKPEKRELLEFVKNWEIEVSQKIPVATL